ncbi:pyridoxal-phosphate dependent enzyme [Pseudonocardia adelaidensis]|uniref:Threonine synthase n=1 Tax=Pseudonocardia adelaidensis TaxID=648754 RepID=A0ABP9NVM8_9PSEU
MTPPAGWRLRAGPAGVDLLDRDGPVPPVRPGRGPGVWRWADLLPLPAGTEHLSLGEGGTPLLGAPRLAAAAGVAEVWLKLDHLNPTGSFKDRAVAVGVADAVRRGAGGIVCGSSGNAAASAAAYAARAGLPAVVVCPEGAPPGKLAAIAAYGAVQVLVPGDYSRSFALAVDLAAELGFANVTTTYVNPAAVTGLRTVAYELVEQLPAPVDRVVVPTSAGPLVHGVRTGFEDAVAAGRAARVPALVAAQPEGCAPVARAFAAGAAAVREWDDVRTAVSGLDDPLRGYAGDGTVTLRAVGETGGAAVALPDEDTAAARALLAEQEGIDVEPAAATAVAALLSLGAGGGLAPAERVVCLLTGHGLKHPPTSAAPATVVTSVGEAVDHVTARAR